MRALNLPVFIRALLDDQLNSFFWRINLTTWSQYTGKGPLREHYEQVIAKKSYKVCKILVDGRKKRSEGGPIVGVGGRVRGGKRGRGKGEEMGEGEGVVVGGWCMLVFSRSICYYSMMFSLKSI